PPRTGLTQTVPCDSDGAATFSNYTTYAWTRCTELTNANHERVVRAIDAAFVAKGLARVEATASLDVLVTYHANFEVDGSPDWGPLVSAQTAWRAARVRRFLVGTPLI